MPITGGPFRDMKYGGINLRPVKDSAGKYMRGGFQFEANQSPNGDTYATAESVVGFVEQECTFTAEEYNELEALRDGKERAGTATTISGQALSFNGIIDGELSLDDGKATVKISGAVRVQ